MNQDPSFTIETNTKKTFEQILELLQNQFIDDESMSISIEDEDVDTGKCMLRVSFEKQDGVNYIDDSTSDSTYRKISKVLKENDIDIRYVGGGNWSRNYIMTRKFIDGNLNWRGWLLRPNGFSPKNRAILDEIASFPEFIEKIENCEGDSLDKFDLLMRLAFHAGIINNEERSDISREKHSTV
jgi:hypothetical protein